jgi:hypothetical protein
VKGTTLNVDPAKPAVHVTTDDQGTVQVKLTELKALFFVKDKRGDPAHNEAVEPTPGDPRLLGGRRIAVRFEDGETVVGMSNRFPPLGQFFYVTPIDPKSNNVRILVNRTATTSIVDASQLSPR